MNSDRFKLSAAEAEAFLNFNANKFYFITVEGTGNIKNDVSELSQQMKLLTDSFMICTHYFKRGFYSKTESIHYHIIALNPQEVGILAFPTLTEQVHDKESVKRITPTTSRLIGALSYALKKPIQCYLQHKQRKDITEFYVRMFNEIGIVKPRYYGVFNAKSKRLSQL